MLKKIKKLLDAHQFLNLATVSGESVPNVAPKFMLSYTDTEIVLADYTIAKTFENIKKNPAVAIPVMDEVSLNGYQIKGRARVVTGGKEHAKFYEAMQDRIVKLSVERIVRGVHAGRESANFEVCLPEKMAFIVVTVHTLTEIHCTGSLSHEHTSVS
jgi:predicted pyridoxine 5'-phosphate oxidase superfamily flavin-nucleotide-binding protein